MIDVGQNRFQPGKKELIIPSIPRGMDPEDPSQGKILGQLPSKKEACTMKPGLYVGDRQA